MGMTYIHQHPEACSGGKDSFRQLEVSRYSYKHKTSFDKSGRQDTETGVLKIEIGLIRYHILRMQVPFGPKTVLGGQASQNVLLTNLQPSGQMQVLFKYTCPKSGHLHPSPEMI